MSRGGPPCAGSRRQRQHFGVMFTVGWTRLPRVAGTLPPTPRHPPPAPPPPRGGRSERGGDGSRGMFVNVLVQLRIFAHYTK
jgi:hypothetical protein